MWGLKRKEKEKEQMVWKQEIKMYDYINILQISKTQRNEEIFIMFYIELQKMSIGRKINKKNPGI